MAPRSVPVVENKIVKIGADNADLLAMSGERNPYPGKLGVVEVGALADLLLIDSNSLQDLKLIEQPDTKLLVIMKDGKLFKDLLK